MKKQLLYAAALLMGFQAVAQGNYPIEKGSQWHYLDNGSDQNGTGWNNLSGTNTTWAEGAAPLGYGDPMNTVISFGPDSGNKFITSYYYRDITIDLANVADMVELGLRRDDGAIVYINGVEVLRNNMPDGTVDYLTHSAAIVDGADEKRFFEFQLPKSVFQNGLNRIAIEMHNRDGQSSDSGFDLYLKDAPVSGEVCQGAHIGCFTSITPTAQTPRLIIAPEFRFQLFHKQGDAYMTGTGTVPGNHDYTAFIGTDGSSTTGHLSVNHENNPGGVSMVDLHFDPATALWAKDNSRAVDLYNTDLVTTNRNCSGGSTPWGTVITSEEATAAGDLNGDGYEDVGWQVEIDPVTASVKEYGNNKQEKLWAMGRMNHENIVVKSDNVTAYYGEDGGTHCVYKFVADAPNNLTSGTVYVLKMDLALSNDEPSSATGTWIQVPNTTQADRNNLASVAGALGGTNFNGVEDCDISPLDGKIYFASKGKNRVYRFKDNGTTISEFETFVGGMSYPIETENGTVTEPWADGNDNIVFDDKGNLWMCQDGGLNYIWVVRPDHTQTNPKVKLFASVPAGAEPTGLTFTPDFKYGFFSVQHPNGDNQPQQDATFGDVNFNASAVVIFALAENLGMQAPVADFTANSIQVNEGETVTFTDISTNNPTAWQWTFEGGTPATSTAQTPTVTYAEAGSYDVTLMTSNIAGESTQLVKSDYILVEDLLGTENPLLKDKLKVYPNPTSGAVSIELHEMAGKKINVTVFDLSGRQLSEIPVQEPAGANQRIVLNLSGYQNQTYVVKVTVDGVSASYKIIKVGQ